MAKRKNLKTFLLIFGGLLFVAGVPYWLQPTDMEILPAKVVGTNWYEDFFIRPDCGCTEDYHFSPLKKNNWSSYNRKRLPFPEKINDLSVWFETNGRPIYDGRRICRAKIFLLYNRWTGNRTQDDPVALLTGCD